MADLNEIRPDLEKILADLDEIKPDLEEIRQDLSVKSTGTDNNHFPMCFLVRSVENRFFMLKPVNQSTGLWFYGRSPTTDRHRRQVGWFSGRVGQVGRVGWVLGLLGHSYLMTSF